MALSLLIAVESSSGATALSVDLRYLQWLSWIIARKSLRGAQVIELRARIHDALVPVRQHSPEKRNETRDNRDD